MSERPVGGFGDRSEVIAEQTGDGLCAVVSDGRVEAERVRRGRCVPLPAEGGVAVTLAEEPRVAEVGELGGFPERRTTVDDAGNAGTAAVGDFKQQRAVAAVRWTEEKEVGREFDFTLGIARGFVEVDDGAVVRVLRMDGEVDAGDDLLVRPGSAEGLPVEDGRAGEDLDAGDAREGGDCDGGQDEQKDCAAAECHWWAVYCVAIQMGSAGHIGPTLIAKIGRSRVGHPGSGHKAHTAGGLRKLVPRWCQ